MAKITTFLYDNHPPSLTAGNYKVSVSQTLTVGEVDDNSPLDLRLAKQKDTGKEELEFIVAGEHYTINQLQINSVFPPANGMGDFSLVLPHIILNRSTLPWENKTGDGENTTPWLALLLFHEGELSTTGKKEGNKKYFVQNIPVSQWEPSSPGDPTKKEDQVSILVCTDEHGWDSNFLPTHDELSKFAHVRSTEKLNEKTGELETTEQAVVVCKRLPEVDEKNIVHLVSLEGRFDEASGKIVGKEIEIDGASYPALVSLYSWEFFCNDHFIISEEVYDVYQKMAAATDKVEIKLIGDSEAAPYNGSDLVDTALTEAVARIVGQTFFATEKLIEKLPQPYQAYKETYQQFREGKSTITDANKGHLKKIDYLLKTFRIGHLPHILKHLNRTPSRLRLPDPVPPPDNDLFNVLQEGYVDIPYQLKTEKIINAYYRGPMIPQASEPSGADSVALFHADKALRYIRNVDKLDVSYAAAWELGKLLAIQNKNLSTALYKWKRASYQAIKQHNKHSSKANVSFPPVPSYVKDWFTMVKDLKNIPFNYLVPDPAMIPFESIRFFEIDETWLSYFIDGAFSIGRISKAEKRHDETLYRHFNFLKTSNGVRAGFLLHSVAVAGWPDLIVYNNQEGHSPLRKEKLSPNLLICLFDEPLGTVGIHQKPESIHFEVKEEDSTEYQKKGITHITTKATPREIAKELIDNAEVEVVRFNLNG